MTSPHENLQNLLKIGSLKAEPPDQAEFSRLVRLASQMLPDAENKANSANSRAMLAYDAAHSLALAALRRLGYRPENRYIVFQALEFTASFPRAKWRVLAECHQRRNVALYEGDYFDDEQMIEELITLTKELQSAVLDLGSIPTD